MIDVVMPQMGESIVEGTLTRWLKKPGEKVERDEPLFEISTDKVDTEIPSPAAGVLSEVLVQEGSTVAINSVVARIGDSAGNGAGAPAPVAAPAAAPPQQQAQPTVSTPPSVDVGPSAAAPEARTTAAAAGPYPAQPAPQQPPPAAPAAPPPAPTAQPDGAEEQQGPLSPLVRKMAREYNIDLSRVKGTGAGGRITKHDVETYMSSQAAQTYSGAPTPEPAATSAGPYPVEPPPAQPQKQPPAPMPLGEAARVRTEPMSTMRQKIAEHMVMSKRTSAHVTTVHRVDMTKIAKLRDKSKAEFQARNGFSLTFLPFVTAAAAEALRSFEIFNASIDGKNIVYHRDINIGIAVALENGLIVPVIRNADEKNVAGLQRSIVDLATRARSRQLKPEEVQGGTFSITNFGSFGSLVGTPIINQPQVAILSTDGVRRRPVVVTLPDGTETIGIHSVGILSLAFDHRAVDGAYAAAFLHDVSQVIETRDWHSELASGAGWA